MNEPKPIASLSPGLLARKGAARPAMRPQLQPLNFEPDGSFSFGSQLRHQHHPQDDLGWNDMGSDMGNEAAAAPEAAEPVAELAPIVPISGAEPVETPVVVPASPALRQIEELAASIAAAPAAKGSRKLRSALKEGRKAAFTLRLDAERHLRLRLACTMQNRSAQQFITEALDQMLGAMPGLDDLARRVQRP